MLLFDEGDPEMNELAQAEIDWLEAEQAEREARMHRLLLPTTRSTTRTSCETKVDKGDEAGLPVTCSACTRWAENHGFKTS